MNITTVGIDLAKDIITVYLQDTQGHCVLSRNLRFKELAEWRVQLPEGCVVGRKHAVQRTTGGTLQFEDRVNIFLDIGEQWVTSRPLFWVSAVYLYLADQVCSYIISN